MTVLEDRIKKLKVNWVIKPNTNTWWEKEMVWAFEEGKSQAKKEFLEILDKGMEVIKILSPLDSESINGFGDGLSWVKKQLEQHRQDGDVEDKA